MAGREADAMDTGEGLAGSPENPHRPNVPYYVEVPLPLPRSPEAGRGGLDRGGVCNLPEYMKLAVCWRYGGDRVEVGQIAFEGSMKATDIGAIYNMRGTVVHVEGLLHEATSLFMLTIVYVNTDKRETYVARKVMRPVEVNGAWQLEWEDPSQDTDDRACAGVATAACVASGIHGGMPLGSVGRRTRGNAMGGMGVVLGMDDGTLVVYVDGSRPHTIKPQGQTGSYSVGGLFASLLGGGSQAGTGQGIASLSATTARAPDGTPENHIAVITRDLRLRVYVWNTSGTDTPREATNKDLREYFGFKPVDEIEDVRALLLGPETGETDNEEWRLSVYAKTATVAKFVGIGGGLGLGTKERLKLEVRFVLDGMPPVPGAESMDLSCFGRRSDELWAAWLTRDGGNVVASRVFVTPIAPCGQGMWKEVCVPVDFALPTLPYGLSIKEYVLDQIFEPVRFCRTDLNDVVIGGVNEIKRQRNEEEIPENANSERLRGYFKRIQFPDSVWLGWLSELQKRDYVLAISTCTNEDPTRVPTMIFVRRATVSVVRMADNLELLRSKLAPRVLIGYGVGENWNATTIAPIRKVNAIASKLSAAHRHVLEKGPLDVHGTIQAAQEAVNTVLATLPANAFASLTAEVQALHPTSYEVAVNMITQNLQPGAQFCHGGHGDCGEGDVARLGLHAVAGTVRQYAAVRLAAALDLLVVGVVLAQMQNTDPQPHPQSVGLAATWCVQLRTVHWLALTPLTGAHRQQAEGIEGLARGITIWLCRMILPPSHRLFLSKYLDYTAGQLAVLSGNDLHEYSVNAWPGPNRVRDYADCVFAHLNSTGDRSRALDECLRDISNLPRYGYHVEHYLLTHAHHRELQMLLEHGDAAPRGESAEGQVLSDWLKGRCQLEMGHPDEATASFTKAVTTLALHPDLSARVQPALVLDVTRQYFSKNFNEHAMRFAENAVDARGEEQRTILDLQLQSALNVGQYDRAWAVLRQLRQMGGSSVDDVVCNFVLHLWRVGQAGLLCQYALADGSPQWAEAFRNLADTRPVSPQEPSLYEFLYSYHVARMEYKNASLAMFVLADRLDKLGVVNDIVLEGQSTALATAIDALSLVPAGDQWLSRPIVRPNRNDRKSPKRDVNNEHIDEHTEDVRPTRVQVVDLAGLRLARCLARARAALLQSSDVPPQDIAYLLPPGLLRHPGDTLGWFRLAPASTTDEDRQMLYTTLANAGLYDHAFTIHAATHPVLQRLRNNGQGIWTESSDGALPICAVFTHLTDRCVRICTSDPADDSWLAHNHVYMVAADGTPCDVLSGSSQDRAWYLLQSYLRRFDGRHSNYSYHYCVADRLLIVDYPLPTWLVHAFKDLGQEALLVRCYLNAGRWEEATRLLVDYLDRMALQYQLDEASIGLRSDVSGWLPWQLVNRVLGALKYVCAHGPDSEKAHNLKYRLLQKLADPRFPQDMDVTGDQQDTGVQGALHAIADVASEVIR